MDATYAKLGEASREIDAEQPWKSNNAATLDGFDMARWLENIQATPLGKAAMRAEMEANESVPLERQSYLAFLTMVKGGGGADYFTLSETKRCAQGNQALAMALAKKLAGRVRALENPVFGACMNVAGHERRTGRQRCDRPMRGSKLYRGGCDSHGSAQRLEQDQMHAGTARCVASADGRRGQCIFQV